jgi:hypothetical protein
MMVVRRVVTKSQQQQRFTVILWWWLCRQLYYTASKTVQSHLQLHAYTIESAGAVQLSADCSSMKRSSLKHERN